MTILNTESGHDEFLIFSDMHFYNNPSKSRIIDGKHSWFVEQTEVFKKITEYAFDNNINIVIHNGDLFENDTRISTQLYNDVWKLLRSSDSCGLKFILNIGNHDVYNMRHNTSLNPFSKVALLVNYPYRDIIINKDTFVRIIPYYYTGIDSKYFSYTKKYKTNILFIHDIVNGLSWSNKIAEDFLDPDILKQWDIIFNGHIHRPQEIKNIVNIGSPMIHDFGEIGERKRIIHYKDGDWKSIYIDHPQFYDLDFSSLSKEKYDEITEDKRNYFRIKVPASNLDDKIFRKFNVFKEVVETERKEMRLNLSNDSTKEDEIDQYVDLFCPEDLDKDQLIKAGNFILNKHRKDNDEGN